MMAETVQDKPGARETLRVTGASKTFSGTRVLSDVSFGVRAGEICALIGQNGSGKSTLIKILSGFHSPDPGLEVRMGGRDIATDLRAGAERTGLAFIHQDLALVPSMTIVENLRINHFRTGFGGRIKWRQERDVVQTAMARVGLYVSPDARLGDLSVTERALVAIARGLSEITHGEGGDGHLLVLDEPTAYLPNTGVARLFEVLRGLAAEGTSVLFVSHRLDEVLENCDRVLVLRNGELVADRPVADTGNRTLVELMIGQRVERLYPARQPRTDSAISIAVEGLAGRHATDLSFAAREGEVVGFVGLPGGGYDEVPYLLAGASKASAGRVSVGGDVLDATRLNPRASLRHGIAMLPADRKALGGAMALTVQENMTLPTLADFTGRGGVVRSRAERRAVMAQLQHYDVRPQRADLSLALMSGGNQQKVLLAKWIMGGPKVLALHEPTQGVDVGAKREVFAHVADLAEQGATVLISSVEYEDLAHLCDRVHVVRAGTIVRTLDGDELTAHEVAAAVYE
jgi:ribose transport system ATP-binding protein